MNTEWSRMRHLSLVVNMCQVLQVPDPTLTLEDFSEEKVVLEKKLLLHIIVIL